MKYYSAGITTLSAYDNNKGEYFDVIKEVNFLMNHLFKIYHIYTYDIEKKASHYAVPIQKKVFGIKKPYYLNFFPIEEDADWFTDVIEEGKYIFVDKKSSLEKKLCHINSEEILNVDAVLTDYFPLTAEILEGECLTFFSSDFLLLEQVLGWMKNLK